MTDLRVNEPIEQHRPGDAFTFVVADLATAGALIDQLTGRGIDAGEAKILVGADGLAAFDHGQRPTEGWFAKLVRSFEAPAGRDADVVEAYREALKQGLTVVLVPLGSSDYDTTVGAIQASGARSISYFTVGSLESIPSTR